MPEWRRRELAETRAVQLPRRVEVEPCPSGLERLEQPHYGGSVFFSSEGIGGCVTCGWQGAPTITHGCVSTWCPACCRDDGVLEPRRVKRNEACPCGSGIKAKRCRCTLFTV